MSSSTSDTDSTFSPSHGFFSQMGSHLQHRSSSSSSSSSTTNNHDDNSNYLFPCLQHLTQLDIEGAFPSERSYKSYGHEMYCFGEIKKVLLQFGKKENNESIDAATAQQQQLSEGHYALYQFWLLLRSHMLRGDGLLLQQDQPQDNDHRERVASLDPHQQHSRQQIDLRRDFRPAWLPDSLVQFIQITEQDDPSSSVKIDLIACPLCSRNVASSSSGLASRSTTTTKTCIDRVPCHVCQNLTPMVCAQCRCHACHAVLCRRCHQLHQSRLRQSQQRQRQQQQLQRQQGQRSEGRIHQRHQDSMRTTTSRSVNSVSRTVVTATRIEESSSASTNHEAHKDALSSWHVLRCHQCHLLKQTCGRPSCVNMENKYHHHHHQKWICATCQQQKWIKQQRKSTSRFFKKSRHWSHWI
ncbi:uncharacterized protein BX664DRAFT_337855 [Halteromyces radiatus]|uniref:uncharacterized protein n=1 Tax=Halteromyces radiatus TaxID=101107 RepID=UPI0022211676|nr:uncharacterized protein BX664DRAFT_337855 [Halteromyces radiatus]KAI8084814.1 hypothetical protein BX664DRAFT_337855 [Halteromyces radiatus]